MINKSIFIDTWDIVSKNTDYFLYIFIGGRGKGKTYSALRPFAEGKKAGLMYVRRSDTEIQNCCNESFNPFKKLNEDLGQDVQMKKMGKYVTINRTTKDVEGNDVVDLIGYSASLSTFGNLRGADFSDVKYIIFDEFINTAPINHLKNEAFLLFNLIETINRNRELLGEESVKVLLLSNANTIDDDIIRTLMLGEDIRKMKENKKHTFKDHERGIYFELFEKGKFEDKKEKTRLYKLTKGTAFYDMALENEFTQDYFGDIKKIKYNDLVPMVAFENVYFYRHKGENIIYASHRKCNVKRYNKQTLLSFKRDYGFAIGNSIERGKILYQNYDIKLEVFHIFQ